MLFISLCSVFSQENTKGNVGFPLLKGPFLGQKPPGSIPEIFAPGSITTEYHEHSSPVFSPDGNEVYWSVFYNFWGPQVIIFMRYENDRWSQAGVAPFSGQYSDGNPCISSDGKKLFFESSRPINKDDSYTGDINIWVVEKENKSWGEPKNLSSIINTGKWERGPSISNNGNLYFCSMRDGGHGKMDLYRSEFKNGSYLEPENLGNQINTSGYESWPFISPDESYLIFESSSAELYISFRNSDGSWSEPVNMSQKLNFTGSQDRFPRLSNDGSYLFFVSNKRIGNPYFEFILELNEIKQKAKNIYNGMGNIFWVDAIVIEDLKPEELKY